VNVCLAASDVLSPSLDRSPMLATATSDVVVIIFNIFLVSHLSADLRRCAVELR